MGGLQVPVAVAVPARRRPSGQKGPVELSEGLSKGMKAAGRKNKPISRSEAALVEDGLRLLRRRADGEVQEDLLQGTQ